MKEIKFRAWQVNNKKMFTFEEMLELGKDIDILLNRSVNIRCGNIVTLFLNENNVHMQYTGLKDKNGTEIYEGDILVVTCYSYEQIESETTGVVEYSEALFGFGLGDGENGWVMLSELQGPYRTDYEVIGNIYENPELLA